MTSSLKPVVLRRMRPLLGTYVEIGLQWRSDVKDVPDTAFEAAFTAIEQVQHSLSFHGPDSELSRLNRSPGCSVPMSSLALRVLRLARGMTMASDGLFNCTVGGALVSRCRLPGHGGGAYLLIGNAHDIDISAGTASLRRPVRITLDGIAKGYAVDRAVIALRRYGIAAGWVNAGGDLRAFGDFTLPVQCREQYSEAAGFGLRDAALASSAAGDHYDAMLPGEIVATDTLRTVTGSWSVLAQQAWRADALTKVAALAPISQCDAILHRLGGRRVFAANTRAA